MTFGRKLRTAIVACVCCGLMVQQSPSWAGPPEAAKSTARVSNSTAPSKKVVPPAPIDVALSTGGTITGRVLEAAQTGVAKTTVKLSQGKQVLAETVTDNEGRFEIHNLRGGTYLVSANQGYGLFRFWAPKTAPPVAHEEVLLMSQAVVIRAQNPDPNGQVLYDNNGQPYARIHVVEEGEIAPENCPPVGSGGLCCVDCITLALLATTTTAIVLLLDDDDDDNPPTSP